MKNKRKTIIIIVLIMLAACIGAATYYIWFRVPAHKDTSGLAGKQGSADYVSGIRYYSQISTEYEVDKIVTYTSYKKADGSTEELKLDVYQAKGDTSADRPAIILFHGGGLTQGDKETDEVMLSMAKELAMLGYVTFDVNYSLSDNSGRKALKSAVNDAAKAVNYIQNNSEKYGINKDKLILAGYSSGATICIDLCHSNKDYGISRSSIIGVVDIAGGRLYSFKQNGYYPQ